MLQGNTRSKPIPSAINPNPSSTSLHKWGNFYLGRKHKIQAYPISHQPQSFKNKQDPKISQSPGSSELSPTEKDSSDPVTLDTTTKNSPPWEDMTTITPSPFETGRFKTEGHQAPPVELIRIYPHPEKESSLVRISDQIRSINQQLFLSKCQKPQDKFTISFVLVKMV